jgi:hypothetical protein
MKLGTVEDLRIELGGLSANGKPRVGRVFASAVKQGAGFTSKYFDLHAAKSWWKQQSNFTIRDVYNGRKKSAIANRVREQHRRNRKDPRAATADKQSALS